MDSLTQAMHLAKIIEDFIVHLAEGEWILPCDCCGFPVPTPFMDEETNEMLCRNCRTNHMNGEHQ